MTLCDKYVSSCLCAKLPVKLPCPVAPQAELVKFPDQESVEIFFSAHGVPKSYVEEAGDPYKVPSCPTAAHCDTHFSAAFLTDPPPPSPPTEPAGRKNRKSCTDADS